MSNGVNDDRGGIKDFVVEHPWKPVKLDPVIRPLIDAALARSRAKGVIHYMFWIWARVQR